MKRTISRLVFLAVVAVLVSRVTGIGAVDMRPCCEDCTPQLETCLTTCGGNQSCIDECHYYYQVCAQACLNCDHWCGGEYGECYQFGCSWPLQCSSQTGCCVWPE